MKRSLYIFTLIFTCLLVACDGTNTDANDNDSGTTHVPLGTGGTAGTYYFVGGGMSSMFQAHEPSINLGVEVTAAGEENARLLSHGDVDLILIDGPTILSYSEEDPDIFEEWRQISAGHGMFTHIVVRESSDIHSFQDLEGKDVGVGAAGSGNIKIIEPLLEAHDMSYDDFNPMYLSFAEQIDAFRAGQIDVAIIVGGPPTSGIVDLESTEDIRLIEIEPEILEELEDLPGVYPEVLPAGTYHVNDDHDLQGVGANTMLVARADLPDDVASMISETLIDQYQVIEDSHPAGAEWNQQAEYLFRGNLLEFHPAVVQVLEEQGIWDEASEYNVVGSD
ncbi:TAXI family TRAP transporter solute-binding subunit [Geomicrobium sediminis]|uniref:TRAP transporter TAXI family solute receptor n=1 Tax=Geomicrobium sediminis TaxID=1347788 RepID=A0ABS2PBS6_9BACL|nr:TAXI family TRAP transporter solute-binding subunit [Geomicrobium sediminis]MBM7632868.1 TRAP transporter TAXI family solute receptor [Geomicrobium sediminis]